MHQAQLRIENEAMTAADADFEVSLPSLGKSFEESDRDVEPLAVTSEKLHLGDTPALLFFWDGIKIHRLTD